MLKPFPFIAVTPSALCPYSDNHSPRAEKAGEGHRPCARRVGRWIWLEAGSTRSLSKMDIMSRSSRNLLPPTMAMWWLHGGSSMSSRVRLSL